MAGDWIKMRVDLFTHPKVISMARQIESRREIGKRLSSGYGGALREIVTRDVTRDVTVASLMRVWCAANAHTDDGIWKNIQLEDLDHIAGIPGFGNMMEAVGWAIFDAENQTVTFPNFLEYNAPARSRGPGMSAAERQRRYRAKRKVDPVTDSVTDRYVTRDAEKRREDIVEREKRARASFPTAEEVAQHGGTRHPPADRAFCDWWWNAMEGAGWTDKEGRHIHPRSWKNAFNAAHSGRVHADQRKAAHSALPPKQQPKQEVRL